MLKLISSFRNVLINDIKTCNQQASSLFHTTSTRDGNWNARNTGPQTFVSLNKKMFEPQLPDEKPRPAFVCHVKENIKYSPKNMWYVASFIRGMSVDEAIKQLSFVLKKGAGDVKQALLEAKEMAVRDHNVEFKSNLWVAESFCGKGRYFKGIRRHARNRHGRVEYKHVHYFVRLEEGEPPKHFYLPHPLTPEEQLDKWVDGMRKRKVISSL